MAAPAGLTLTARTSLHHDRLDPRFPRYAAALSPVVGTAQDPLIAEILIVVPGGPPSTVRLGLLLRWETQRRGVLAGQRRERLGHVHRGRAARPPGQPHDLPGQLRT